jgi:hypothetical protein
VGGEPLYLMKWPSDAIPLHMAMHVLTIQTVFSAWNGTSNMYSFGQSRTRQSRTGSGPVIFGIIVTALRSFCLRV